MFEELTLIRAMIAGEAEPGRKEGMAAFRTALRRLFERFELLSVAEWGHSPRAGTVGAPHEALAAGDYLIHPHIRREAIQGWDDGEQFPALGRAALDLCVNGADGLRS